jgi:hypothetical protein
MALPAMELIPWRCGGMVLDVARRDRWRINRQSDEQLLYYVDLRIYQFGASGKRLGAGDEWGKLSQFFHIRRGEKPTYRRMPSLNLLDGEPAMRLLQVLKGIREWEPSVARLE